MKNWKNAELKTLNFMDTTVTIEDVLNDFNQDDTNYGIDTLGLFEGDPWCWDHFKWHKHS